MAQAKRAKTATGQAPAKSAAARSRVREAIDAGDVGMLAADPAHADGKLDIALDESFPTSDAPANTAGSSEPAPSSGFDEEAERRIQEEREQVRRERAYALWEAEGRPEGQHEEHWHRARSTDA